MCVASFSQITSSWSANSASRVETDDTLLCRNKKQLKNLQNNEENVRCIKWPRRPIVWWYLKQHVLDSRKIWLEAGRKIEDVSLQEDMHQYIVRYCACMVQTLVGPMSTWCWLSTLCRLSCGWFLRGEDVSMDQVCSEGEGWLSQVFVLQYREPLIHGNHTWSGLHQQVRLLW